MAKLTTKIVMLEGEQGTNIKSVEKSASDGLTDTYTITLTDGSTTSFTVTNGKDGKDGAKRVTRVKRAMQEALLMLTQSFQPHPQILYRIKL